METNETKAPLILAMETATAVSSVAVFEGEQMRGGIEFRTDRLHAKLLTVMIEQLMADLSLEMKSLDAIGIASGPGSYTGLRVGVSVAKGICFAIDKPLITIDSLQALAASVLDFAASVDAWICPMIDARRMEVYTACFDTLLTPIVPVKASIVDEQFMAELLPHKRILFLGDGAGKCQDIIHHPNAIFLQERQSTAFGMGGSLLRKYQNRQFSDLTAFEPFYLKDFVATQSKKKLI